MTFSKFRQKNIGKKVASRHPEAKTGDFRYKNLSGRGATLENKVAPGWHLLGQGGTWKARFQATSCVKKVSDRGRRVEKSLDNSRQRRRQKNQLFGFKFWPLAV